MTIYRFFVFLHVLAGISALTMFWITLALRKGTPLHVRVGRGYLIAMLAVLGTAIVLSAAAFLQGAWITGTFLAYLVVITATPGWVAWRAIRDQRDAARFTGPVYRALAWINVIAASIVLALGLRIGHPLLIGLSAIGLIAGPAMLRFAHVATPRDRRWWLVQHISGITGAATATHVAFLGIGLTRLLPDELAPVAQTLSWAIPISASLLVRLWLRSRFGTARQSVSQSAGAHPVAAACCSSSRSESHA